MSAELGDNKLRKIIDSTYDEKLWFQKPDDPPLGPNDHAAASAVRSLKDIDFEREREHGALAFTHENPEIDVQIQEIAAILSGMWQGQIQYGQPRLAELLRNIYLQSPNESSEEFLSTLFATCISSGLTCANQPLDYYPRYKGVRRQSPGMTVSGFSEQTKSSDRFP